MFHLQTRVELEEEELVAGGIVEVLHGARADVTDGLGQALGRQFHFSEHFPGCDDGGPLLEDLLETTLGGAVAAVEGDGVAVLVSHDLHLQVARVRAQLHHEDGRAWHLVLHLREARLELRQVLYHANAFATTTFRGLNDAHHYVIIH